MERGIRQAEHFERFKEAGFWPDKVTRTRIYGGWSVGHVMRFLVPLNFFFVKSPFWPFCQVVVLQVDPETVKERLATRLIDRQEDKVYSEKERQLMPKDKAIKKRLTRRRHDYFTHILVGYYYCPNTRQSCSGHFFLSGKCV